MTQMTAVRVAEATGRALERWDEDVDRAVNGTLFHLRRFLGYHGDRFAGRERFLCLLKGDGLLAQIAVVVAEETAGRHVLSPYGASYGGFALQRYPTFTEACGIVEAFVGWCEREGATRATITPPIAACAALPLDVLSFALLAGGFRSVNRDISSLVWLDPEVAVDQTVSARARNTARRAGRDGVTVARQADIDAFWRVMDAGFSRHGAVPTHTCDEFRWLCETLPERVYFDVAYCDRDAVAGVAYFAINRLVNSSFYFCQRPDRRELNGLTACVLHGLERSRREGYRWFDFGTSTAGMTARENVFRFKEQFGSVGQFRETFEWSRGPA
jgi:hypothetical protein